MVNSRYGLYIIIEHTVRWDGVAQLQRCTPRTEVICRISRLCNSSGNDACPYFRASCLYVLLCHIMESPYKDPVQNHICPDDHICSHWA